jgi:hypothetical protein
MQNIEDDENDIKIASMSDGVEQGTVLTETKTTIKKIIYLINLFLISCFEILFIYNIII